MFVVFIKVWKSLTREHTSSHHPHTNGNNPISTNINSETCHEKSWSITIRITVLFTEMFEVVYEKKHTILYIQIWLSQKRGRNFRQLCQTMVWILHNYTYWLAICFEINHIAKVSLHDQYAIISIIKYSLR